MILRKRLGRFALYAMTILTCAIFLFPFFSMIMTSLKTYRESISLPIHLLPQHPTLDAYFQITDYIPLGGYAVNSFVLVILNILGTLISCPLVAYSFARLNWKGREALFFVTIAVMIVPQQVTMVPLFLLFSKLGLTNSSIVPLVLPQFFGTPFYIFLMRQFFKAMPGDLESAAKIDGCSAPGTYLRIFLPLALPGLLSLSIYQFIATWNDFTGPLIYLQDYRRWTLQLGLNMFKRARGTMWPPMMATATLMCVPVLILFFFAQRHFIDSITFSGIKG